MEIGSVGPHHVTCCPYCDELIAVRAGNPSENLEALGEAYQIHLNNSPGCKASREAEPTATEMLAELRELLSGLQPEAMDMFQESGNDEMPINPTDAQLADACMWLSHDFGLLGEVERRERMVTMREYWRAIWKACNTPGRGEQFVPCDNCGAAHAPGQNSLCET